MADTPIARLLSGRKPIYTDVQVVTADNVCDVLNKALAVHDPNRGDIQYLYDYYRGKTPIRFKEKEVRPSVNHRLNENRAYQIVEFKNATCFGEPVQYISRGEASGLLEQIDDLNDYMVATEKEAADRDLGEWMHIAGVGYRMTLPNKGFQPDDPDGGAPFAHYTLDPRLNFIVRSSGFDHRPLMSVTVVPQESGRPDLHCVYTPDAYYEIEGTSSVARTEPNPLGMIPVVEYPLNPARIGAFEIALPLLDAINELESNRMDDVQQFVNSFLALLGGGMDDDTYKKLEEYKMLCLPEGVDAKYLSVALQQGDMQTLKDNLYQSVLTVCGMPSQAAETSSTSDTGIAVMYRGGWSQAEARAKSTEVEFKRSEKLFLRLILRIMRDTAGTDLKVQDIEIKFTRRFVDDIGTKVTALQGLLNAGISPEVAIYTCGLWNDPTDVYMKSKKYLAQWELNEDEDTADVREGGRDEPLAGEAGEEDVRQAP